MMTEQEVFDTVIKHLRQQGCKAASETDDSYCLYRGPNNTKCAAGCLIPDDEYKSELEGHSVNAAMGMLNFVENYPKTYDIFVQHKELISALQTVHDNYSVVEWERVFQWIAQSFCLTYTPPEL